MNRSEFMEKLEEFLAELSPQERQEAIDYYNSYMDDAGIGDDDTVPESIGTPEQVAKELKLSILNPDIDFMADEKINHNTPKMHFEEKKKGASERKKYSSGEMAAIIIGLLVTSPIWLSLAFGILGILFGLGVAVISVVFAFFIVALCLVVTGVCLCIAGISMLVSQPAAGIGVIGAGCIVLSIGIIATVLMVNCMVVFFPWLIRTIEKMAGKIKRKGGKNDEKVY